MIERLILVVGHVLGHLEPQRMRVVDLARAYRAGLVLMLVRLVRLALLCAPLPAPPPLLPSVSPIMLSIMGVGMNAQYLSSTSRMRSGFQEFQAFLIQVQRHRGAAGLAIALAHVVLHAVGGYPAHRGRALLPAQGIDLHLLGGHERRIEALLQSEMTDYAVAASLCRSDTFFDKLGRARERNLRDVLFPPRRRSCPRRYR